MKNSSHPEIKDQLEAYPNPFSEETTIQFSSGVTQNVKVCIYYLTGQEIATLFNAEAEAGAVIKLDFKSDEVASGIYFVRMIQANGNVITEKLVLQK